MSGLHWRCTLPLGMSSSPVQTLVTLLIGAALGAIAPAIAADTWESLDMKRRVLLDAKDPALGLVIPLKARDRLVIMPKGRENLFGVTMDNGPTCTVTMADGVGFTLLTMAADGETYGLTVGTDEGHLTAAWQGPDAEPAVQQQ
jgi:hypothetical protein